MRCFHYTFAIKLLGSFFLIFFSFICFSATSDMDVSGSDHHNGSMNRSWKTLTPLCFNESTSGDILAVGVRLEEVGVAATDINSRYIAEGSDDKAIWPNLFSCDKQPISDHTLSGINYTDGGNSRKFFSGSAKEWDAELVSNASEIILNRYTFYSAAPNVQLISGKIPSQEYHPNHLIFSNF